MTRLLLSIVLLFTLLIADSFGQQICPPPTVATSITAVPSGGRDVSFAITGPTACAHTFYLFGDGHYSFQRNPLHEYRTNSIFTPEVYALEAYDVSVPGKVGLTGPSPNIDLSNATPLNPGSSTSQPYFSGPVHLGQSWRAADGNEMIYIVSFQHPGGSTIPADGSVTLELDPQIDVIPSSLSNPPQDWGNAPIYTPKGGGRGDQIEWRFTNLKVGSSNARHFYVHVSIPPGLLKKDITSTVTAEYVGLTVSTDILQSTVFTYPHDPNTIMVNRDCAQGNIGDSQVLEYTVHFQNEGNGFANTVQVQVNPSWQLLPQSISVLETSAPISPVEVDINNQIYFTFPDIYLPGTKQVVPNSYTPDQTTGFVKFSICTDAPLPPGGWGDPQAEVSAEAFIYFDNQPPIWTGASTILTEDFCAEYDFCDMSQNLVLSSNPTISTADDVLTAQLSPSIEVYPNPTSNRINIEYSVVEQEGATVGISLRSISGQQQAVILSEQFQQKGTYNMGYDLSRLPSGIYVIEIQNGDHTELRRVVKME